MPEHFITLAQAIDLTKRFRDNKETILKSEFAGREILTICDTLPKEVFQTLMSKPGCVSIRIYYGMDSSLKVRPVIVPVNSSGQDILPQSGGAPNFDGGSDIGDDTMRCPPHCPPPSPLNQP